MSNRVEELESKVAELQAAVNGLTEELVETKERVRLLEDQVEVDLTAGSRPVGHAPAQPDVESDAEPEVQAADQSDETTAQAESDEQTDDSNSHLRESPAQAMSRAETSAQPSDDASLIDADANDSTVSDPTESEDDEVKSDESESDDEAESAEDDSDIIVA
ncbi:spore germination protein GerPC [Halogeometricum borinquense]|uniref:spore germination protein GerPC n=1 Tax=Halogeometricum borinquense TaxID=60847 RepID=UPI00019E672F|nr:hypothetical protein [Halogeometricum borinquense]